MLRHMGMVSVWVWSQNCSKINDNKVGLEGIVLELALICRTRFFAALDLSDKVLCGPSAGRARIRFLIQYVYLV